jgi:hypothetical protein
MCMTYQLRMFFFYKYYYHIYGTDIGDGKLGIKLKVFKAAGKSWNPRIVISFTGC